MRSSNENKPSSSKKNKNKPNKKQGSKSRADDGKPQGASNHRRGWFSSSRKKTAQAGSPAQGAQPGPRPPQPSLRHESASAAEAKNKHLVTARRDTASMIESWRKEGAAIKQAASGPSKGAFALDQWQEDAVNALLAGANVIVDAPTTAGKTRVVESFFQQHIDDVGFRACYTCPVKSLSNDKLKEFRQRYGKQRVGIATGDIKDNLDAPIVVATLESYRNSLLGTEPDLGRKLVIYDEYHYLQDESRGSAWEESIILTPPECQMLLLSASLSNANEFADWLEHLTGRPSVLITAKTRPVPLVDMVWYEGEWFVADTLPKSVLAKRRKDIYLEPLNQQVLADRLVPLVALGLTPCIVYCGKRLSCEHLAKAIAARLPPLGDKERHAIGEALKEADAENRVFAFLTPQIRQLIQTYGVAYHHSGLTPPLRVTIERLVKEGLLRFCTATMGLSLGINFSVKATVISDAVRPGDAGFTPYGSSEVLQMTGRAGRRGMDAVGFSCWPNEDYYYKYSHAERERCASRLRNDPTTFLGLVSRSYNLGQIEQFYRKSFLKFKNPRVDVQLVAPARLRKRLAAEALPCLSPAHEYSAYWSDQNALCYDCPLLARCHATIAEQKSTRLSLAALHMHLHAVGALEGNEALSELGSLARFFPQAGGFLVANMIIRQEITPATLLDAAQLMASFSLARFKFPNPPPFIYRFPFKDVTIEKDLRVFYPLELFPEAYEPAKGSKKHYVFKEFNPAAGYVIKLWADGLSWPDLLKQVTNEQFGAGDLMALIYRTASYLQSLVQARHGALSEGARELREFMLREPIHIAT